MLFSKEAFRRRRLHFIGIGGIGMSGVAEILLNLGYTVTGSDLFESETTARLRRLGATVHKGHSPGNLGHPEAVVTSSAIPATNAELAEARRRNLPVISRGEMLAELMRVKYGVAVAGSHGKTSTASLCAAVLAAGGKDPTVVIGGRVASFGSNARLGNSDYFLVEADESDGSFLALDPIVSVITNVDREHMDYYRSLSSLLRAFENFANSVPFYGAVVMCVDDPLTRELAGRVRRRRRTYGMRAISPGADLVADHVRLAAGKACFALSLDGTDLGEFEVSGVGLHTVRNAMAAVLVGMELEVSVDHVRSALAGFGGVARRFETRGTVRGVTVIDDYGHHPTEIKATLAAAASCGFRAVNVLFQPHRYTRTRDLEDEFATCFSDCDRLWMLDIYAAGEPALPGVTGPRLAEAVVRAGHPQIDYCPSMKDAVDQIAAVAGPGEAVITLGAGNVGMAGELLLERLGTVGGTGRGRPASVASTLLDEEGASR